MDKIKISLELEINGEKKVFVAKELKGRVYREIFKMNRLLNDGINENTLDTLTEFVAHDIFGDKFTIDQYYDCVPAAKCLTEIMRVLSDVMDMITKGIEQDTHE